MRCKPRAAYVARSQPHTRLSSPGLRNCALEPGDPYSETPVIEPRSCGVLVCPPEPVTGRAIARPGGGDDSCVCGTISPSFRRRASRENPTTAGQVAGWIGPAPNRAHPGMTSGRQYDQPFRTLILRCSKACHRDPSNGQWQLARLVYIGASGMQASESALRAPKREREETCID